MIAIPADMAVEEYVIEPREMPGQYEARLAIRYSREEFVAACVVGDAFVRGEYRNVVIMGRLGSRNGDQVTIYFWSSGKQQQEAGAV